MVKFELPLNPEQKKKITEVITHVPKNEEEVKRIFYRLGEALHFDDVRVFIRYPDASAFYNGKKIDIEFEKNSSNFKQHGHDENLCDLIVCWEDDEPSLRVPVLELATLVEDWLEARKNAISSYYNSSVLLSESKNHEEVENLTDKYDFNIDDVLKQFVGLTQSGVNYYSSILGKKPECQGGKLVCEKRDLETIHLGIDWDREIVPVVLCKECKNKDKCKLGKVEKIGYYFLVIGDIKRTRDVRIRKIKIPNEKLVPKMNKTELNIWNALRFNRR